MPSQSDNDLILIQQALDDLGGLQGYQSAAVPALDRLRGERDRLKAEVWRLKGCLKTANSNHEHFEREWYLRGDCIEELEKDNKHLVGKVDNLAALVRMLVHSLRKVNPNSSNIIRAMDYLTRNGLTGSILRSDERQPDPSESFEECDVCGGGGVCP